MAYTQAQREATREMARQMVRDEITNQQQVIALLRSIEAENLRDTGRWRALDKYQVTEIPLTLQVERPLAYSRLGTCPVWGGCENCN